MKKIVRLTEKDLTRIIKNVLNEDIDEGLLDSVGDSLKSYGSRWGAPIIDKIKNKKKGKGSNTSYEMEELEDAATSCAMEMLNLSDLTKIPACLKIGIKSKAKKIPILGGAVSPNDMGDYLDCGIEIFKAGKTGKDAIKFLTCMKDKV